MEEQTKEQLLARIRELEAQVRSLNNSIIDRKDEYGLRWIDVPEAFEAESENKIPILEEVKDLAIKNDDGKPTHILIEGDNYHALQCLNYTHKGKIDVIYIDPPYNTGKEFVYKDKRVLDKFPNGQTIDGNHPLRHSAWLSFMNKRLELAKNLLSERGVIFISIDDNEQANLKLLCDKNFGENNFIASMIWRGGKRNMSKWVSTSHEYMLLYARNLKFCDTHNVEWFEKKKGLDAIYKAAAKFLKETKNDYSESSALLKKWFKSLSDSDPSKDHEHYCWIDERGVYFASDISRGGGGGPTWKIQNPFTGEVVNTPQRGWAYSTIEELNKDISDGLIHFNGSGVPCKKRYLRENETQILDTVFYKDRRGSGKRLKKMMSAETFPFPKDELIIEEKLQSFSQRNSIILDFFAGSGTTMHATMNCNRNDNGLRQCILVQTPESTYEIKNNSKVAKKEFEEAYKNGYERISEITYERNRRVIQGYANAKGEQVAGLGNSLKYYKTAFVGNNTAASATDEDKVALAHKAGNLIAIAENTLEEIETTDSYQIFQNGNQYTAIYFTGNLEHFAEYAQKIEELRNSSRLVKVAAYIYCIGNVDVFECEFNKLARITLHAIPQPIIEIYKQLNA